MLALLLALPVLASAADDTTAGAATRALPVVSTVVFRGVDVFDGEAVRRGQDVVVRDGRVVSAGPAEGDAAAGVTVGVERIPCPGCTLLPGLVDSHVHLTLAGDAPWALPNLDIAGNARRWLEAGVTSVLCAMSGAVEARLARKDAARAGLPHLYLAGPGLTARDGHPIPMLRDKVPWPFGSLLAAAQPAADDPEEARAWVRRIHRRFDPPLLKILHDELPPGAPVLKPEVLAAAVDEAHRLGMRAVVHAASPARWREVVESGADLLLHAVFSAPLAETEIEYFTARDLPFVPTLRAVAWPTDLARGEISDFERATIAARRIEAFRQPPAHWDWDKEAGYADLTGGTSALAADNTVRLARAGVPFFAGTDGGVPGVFPGAGLHRELALYVDLGLAPEEVLRAATSRPAAFLDPEGASGRVLPGYRADLLLVHGDPTTDIRALDRVALVCVSGDDATRCLAGE